MKKIILSLSLLLALSAAEMKTAAAEPRGRGFEFAVETRYNMPFGHTKEFSAIDVEAAFGYSFDDRWSLLLPITASTGLFDAAGVRSYEIAGLVGLGCEYNVMNRRNFSLSLSPRVQTTLGGDWQYMCYDLGVRMRYFTGPSGGLGFRYMDTYKTAIESRFCLYISFGFALFDR